MMLKIFDNSAKMMQNASSAELVAKIVLEAATSPSPHVRYPVGKDVMWLEARRKLSKNYMI
jgi:hypothetical protein